MEKELVWKMVQGQIGYDFKNLDLLQQAFTRRSYTAENGGENNEVLEFIGDKALDFMVVKLLIQKYGYLANRDPIDGTKISVWEQEFKRNQEGCEAPAVNSFGCDYDEDDLSKIKSRMVNKKALARRMDELGFSEHSLPVFCGFGVSIREARMAACKLAYFYVFLAYFLFGSFNMPRIS